MFPPLRFFLSLSLLALTACSDRDPGPIDQIAQPLPGDPQSWQQRQKLTATNAAAGDQFGNRIALSGDTLLVGAPYDDQAARDAGAAYVFTRGAAGWVLQQKLVVAGGSVSDFAGVSVALNGDTAVLGAWGVDGTGFDSGAAYVFTRSGSTWTQQAKLTASDPVEQDHFGVSVAVVGSNLVVSAPSKKNGNLYGVGAAYAFTGGGAQWKLVSKLMPTNTANDNDGTGLALSATTLALGTDRLRGYVVTYYTLVNGAWTLGPAAISSTNTIFPHFGSRLALSSDYTVIGAYTDDIGTTTTPGSVIVVSNANHATQWTLKPSDGNSNDQFGSSVAISETDTVVVGSPRDDDHGQDSGSVYVYGFANGAWSELQKLSPEDGAANDRFGNDVAIAGTTALVGAPLAAQNMGALYSHGYGWFNGSGCAQNDECGSGHCVENVCCDTACDGLCRSCLAVNTNGKNGFCSNISNTLDPYQECTDSGAGSCASSGLCDGNGACAKYPVGTSCNLTSCVTPTAAPGAPSCDASGSCIASASTACALGYRCNAGVCSTQCQSSSDCDQTLGFTCSPNQLCEPSSGGGGSGSGGGGNAGSGGALALGGAGAGGSPPTGSSGSAGLSAGGAGASGFGSGGTSLGGAAGALLGVGGTAGLASAAGSGTAGRSNEGTGQQCQSSADCPSGLACDPVSRTCQDLLVTACSCRAAGGRPSGGQHWLWLGGALIAAATLRRRLKVSAGRPTLPR